MAATVSFGWPKVRRIFFNLFLANPKSPFLGNGKIHPFIHLSIGFHRIRHNSVGAICRRIFWSSIPLFLDAKLNCLK